MKVKLHNVGIISDREVEFSPGINIIIGSSGSGKSTLMRSIRNIVSNCFSDSDISFGKNTMEINVCEDNNNVSYTRHIKTKGDKCYYTVNDEQYVKLGRQSLQAVTDILRIGDVDINGESINFNFNLQFSSPFLILGSQSTLYNVLTYRSNFDISSINDYYAADIKSNSTEIATHKSLLERLNDNLESLCKQKDKLFPIEKLYSDYTLYKHKMSVLDDITELYNVLNEKSDIEYNIANYNNIISNVENLLSKFELYNDFEKYSNDYKSLEFANIYISKCNDAIKDIDSALKHISIIEDLSKVLNHNNTFIAYNDIIKTSERIICSCDKVLSKEHTVKDINSIINIYNSLKRCNSIVNLIGNNILKDNQKIVDDLITLYNTYCTLKNTNSNIVALEDNINSISKELNKFDVCPLCNQPLCSHEK